MSDERDPGDEDRDEVLTFDPVERAREKAASRAEDARALAAGEVTRDDMRRNASFAFPAAHIRFKGKR